MKLAFLTLAALTLSPQAFALTTCAGETLDGTLVSIRITTAGFSGTVQDGTVTIAPVGEPSRSYGFRKEEVSQFFESTTDDGRHAVAGLSAYVSGENPVTLRYAGPNVQEDLVDALRSPSREKVAGNEMRVWKGPGYAADQQHQFRDIVCQIFLELP